MSVTIDLANDEQLNQEIDALIRARVISITRSECDMSVDEIAKKEAARILGDRLLKLSTETGIENLAKQVIRSYMTQVFGEMALRSAVRDVLESDEFRPRIQKIIENTISNYCDNFATKHVQSTLGQLVPADVIAAVVNAMDQKRKEG